MGKSYKKRKEAAERTNKQIAFQILSNGSEFLYGRVKRALGFSTFEVLTSDGYIRQATLPGTFRKTIIIATGNIVVLEKGEPGLPVQVKALISRTNAQQLYKCGVIPKNIYYDEEDMKEDELEGFDIDYSEEKEEDEVDVDAI